jgi:hypothetical protein
MNLPLYQSVEPSDEKYLRSSTIFDFSWRIVLVQYFWAINKINQFVRFHALQAIFFQIACCDSGCCYNYNGS